MATRYSTNILDRLTQRAEARVERIQRVRELGGLPPTPEPTYNQLWSPNYEYMNNLSAYSAASPLATQYGADNHIAASEAQQKIFEALMRNIQEQNHERVRERAAMNLFAGSEVDHLLLKMGSMSQEQYNKRKMEREAKNQPVNNQIAKFMLDSDY